MIITITGVAQGSVLGEHLHTYMIISNLIMII